MIMKPFLPLIATGPRAKPAKTSREKRRHLVLNPPFQKSGRGRPDVNPLSRDEAYWRDRARPWKERLAEAKEKYEDANKKYMEKSEQLSQRKFGSRTQYKMDIAQLDKLNGERKEYEARMNEAKEMLGKISKEAEEIKADPEWVK